MGKVKTLLDSSEDTVIDEQIDARREAKSLGRHLKSLQGDASHLGDSLGRAQRRWDAADSAERARLRRDEDDDYGDAIRLGYVWAALVFVIAALLFMGTWGIIPG
jgi:hypothetical protein